MIQMGITDLIFPKSCLVCKKTGSYVCTKCIKKLHKVDQICGECTKPAIDGMTHEKCKKKNGIERTIVLWPYRGVVRKALLSMKYKFASNIANDLSVHIVDSLVNVFNLPKGAVLIPIPLHRKRRNWRGFNQSEEVGRILASKMKWKMVPDLLVRKSFSKAQTDLKKEDRQKNILGNFVFNEKYSKVNLKDKTLVLFDDVWTTGSTIREAAKILRKRKPGRLIVITIAHGN